MKIQDKLPTLTQVVEQDKKVSFYSGSSKLCWVLAATRPQLAVGRENVNDASKAAAYVALFACGIIAAQR